MSAGGSAQKSHEHSCHLWGPGGNALQLNLGGDQRAQDGTLLLLQPLHLAAHRSHPAVVLGGLHASTKDSPEVASPDTSVRAPVRVARIFVVVGRAEPGSDSGGTCSARAAACAAAALASCCSCRRPSSATLCACACSMPSTLRRCACAAAFWPRATLDCQTCERPRRRTCMTACRSALPGVAAPRLLPTVRAACSEVICCCWVATRACSSCAVAALRRHGSEESGRPLCWQGRQAPPLDQLELQGSDQALAAAAAWPSTEPAGSRPDLSLLPRQRRARARQYPPSGCRRGSRGLRLALAPALGACQLMCGPSQPPRRLRGLPCLLGEKGQASCRLAWWWL